MTITSWYEDFNVNNLSIRAGLTFDNGNADIELNDKYSLMQISCIVTDFEMDKYFNFSVDIECENCFVDRILCWRKNGVNILEEYFNDGEDVLPYGEADEIKVSILVRGNKGKAKISPLKVSYGETVKERKAVVSALSIPYGFIYEHPLRTCEDNLRDTLSRIDRLCKEDKVDLIVLTETFYSRIITAPYMDTFLTIDSPQIQLLRDKAKEHNLYLAFSFREIDKDNLTYNSAIIIDRQGEIIAHYHKTHLTMSEKQIGLKPGEEYVVVDTDIGKMGIAICWDLYFPEFSRVMAKKGAQIIINPSAGYISEMHKMRATDSGTYVVTGGVWSNTTSVIDPSGEIIADGSCTGAAIAQIDLNKRFPVKYLSVDSYAEKRNVYFKELRPDLYDFI